MDITFDGLDVYVLGHIFDYFSFEELAKLRSINKKCYEACMPKLKKHYEPSKNDYYFAKCTRKGYLKSTMWFIDTFENNVCINKSTIYKVIFNLCSNNNLKIAKKIYNMNPRFESTKDVNDRIEHFNSYDAMSQAFKTCCLNGYLKSVKWLIKIFDVREHMLRNSNYDIIILSCVNGHFDVVEFLINRYHLSHYSLEYCYKRLLTLCCLLGDRFSVFKWFTEKYKQYIYKEGNELLFILSDINNVKKDNNEMISYINKTFNY